MEKEDEDEEEESGARSDTSVHAYLIFSCPKKAF